MKRILRTLHWITHRPSMQVLVGLILFASGLYETWQIVSSDLSAPVVGAHHGAMLFGAFYAIRNLPDVFAGIEYLVETEEV